MLYHIGFGQHYFKFLNLSAGIHLFFCISAFLVMYSTKNKTAGVFLKRRLIRIVPLYFILTVATFIASKFIGSFAQGDIGIPELIKSLLFLPYSRSSLSGYTVVRPIVGPAWTLYYDFWFAVIFCIAMKCKHKYRGIISAAACIAVSAISLILPSGIAVTGFLRTGFFLDFAVGIGAYYVWSLLLQKKEKLPSPLFCIIAIAATALLYLGPRNLFLLEGAVFLILLSTLLCTNEKPVLKPFNLFAKVSYSFYLIHYYVIIILGKLFDFSVFSAATLLGTAVTFILTLIAAYCSYLLVEKKLCNLLLSLTKAK